MRKRFLSAILVLCMVLGLLPAQAFAADDAITYKANTYTWRASVASCSKTATGDVAISTIYNTCSVEQIDSGAFTGCAIRSVYIPASIISIADDAFDSGSEIIIRCSKYSYAFQYAVNKNLRYELTVDDDSKTVYLDDFSPVACERYTGNQGDSFIAPYDIPSTVTGISGKQYSRGVEAWIARWNFGDKKSWAWNEYRIDQAYQKLTGFIDVKGNYNTNTYNTTVQIAGDGSVLKEYVLTPDTTYPVEIDVDISSITLLKIYVFDNTETARGSMFILGNLAVVKGDEGDEASLIQIDDRNIKFEMMEGPYNLFNARLSIELEGLFSLGDGSIELYRADNGQMIERINAKDILEVEPETSVDALMSTIRRQVNDDGTEETKIEAYFCNLPANIRIYPVLTEGLLKNDKAGKETGKYVSKNKVSVLTPIDRWSFCNTDEFFSTSYILTEEDSIKLQKALNVLERYRIVKGILKKEWGGSCHGMSVATVLNALDVIEPDLFYGNTDYLYSIPKTKGDYVEAKINYYHVLQNTSTYLREEKRFMKLDTIEQLKIIDDLGEKANNGGKPFFLSFELYVVNEKSNKEELTAHCVVGFGKETGTWDIYHPILHTTIHFPSRILIYDCSGVPSEHTYMYYNCGTGEWFIEEYFIEGDKEATKLKLATNEVPILDSVDYKKGRSVSSPDVTMLSLSSQNGNFDFDLTMDSQTYHITPSTDLRDIGLISFFDSSIAYQDGEIIPPNNMNVFLTESVQTYEVVPSEKTPVDFTLYAQNIGLAVQANACDSIVFNDESISGKGIDGNYTFEVLFNDGYSDFPWYQTTILGDGATNITISKVDNGLIIAGDLLKNISATVQNDDEEKSVRFSTEKPEALLTNRTTETGYAPVIMIDEDNDGTYETPIAGLPVCTITFNPNGGKVTAASAVTNEYGTLDTLPTPTRVGYTFDGWYTEPVGGEQITTETVFTADTTVYAHWIRNERPPVVPVQPGKPDDSVEDVTPTVPEQPEKPDETPQLPETPDTGSTANPFRDVPSGSFYADAVAWAAANGITSGKGDGLFEPFAPCTRSQTVTFLWRAAGMPEPERDAMPFADVGADAYYRKAVLWAIENGITKGVSADRFDPEGECTRAQIVTFLWRAAGSPRVPAANPFADVSADAYYAEAVLWAAANGITTGTSQNAFSPDKTCMRAEIVTFLYRANHK